MREIHLGFSTRLFTSQLPTSEMAKIWLMESGLLPAAEAKKVLERKLQKTGKFSSPAKSAASTPKNPLQISDREQGNKKTII
ncbi:hypothetical protein DY000_02023926 [Brassica cretica]|uniref:Uncharacterized protein n=1 Tax=Brassica cretica TaxID=69181 RepID=A0ABQ7E326_BRACR|nr:hypothetical protein DY000_02023926 [Brassica cretica]